MRLRSASEQSYGAFHAGGPKVLRCRSVTCRKATAYSSAGQCVVEHWSTASFSTFKYNHFMPAFTPCGTSYANLADACKHKEYDGSKSHLPGVRCLTGPSGFCVQGPVDNFTQKRTGESPVVWCLVRQYNGSSLFL